MAPYPQDSYRIIYYKIPPHDEGNHFGIDTYVCIFTDTYNYVFTYDVLYQHPRNYPLRHGKYHLLETTRPWNADKSFYRISRGLTNVGATLGNDRVGALGRETDSLDLSGALR